MLTDYSPFAADYYINQRINLKMDIPMRRDTVLSLFDRIRRDQPSMDRFRRYSDELALESRPSTSALSGPQAQQWVAVRRTSVRSGSVNPQTTEVGYKLHRLVLESAPFFLDISPLDVDHLEALYGFDLLASGNHDAIIFNALFAGSPMAEVAAQIAPASRHPIVLECQPLLGMALTDECDVQAHFEVKTRSGLRGARAGGGYGSGSGSAGGSASAGGADFGEQPISVYLVVRRYGSFNDMHALSGVFDQLTQHAERLVESVVIPKLLAPIREAIASGGWGR